MLSAEVAVNLLAVLKAVLTKLCSSPGMCNCLGFRAVAHPRRATEFFPTLKLTDLQQLKLEEFKENIQ